VSALRWRPIPESDPVLPEGALPLAGGRLWFDRLAVHARGRPVRLVPAAEAPREVLERLSVARAPICGLDLAVPRIMGVVNVTPDSFSDGGLFAGLEAAVAQGRALVEAGADILDIGGESTRPGAAPVPVEEECRRILPVIRALAAVAPVSVDTRNAATMRAALEAGARIVNDVSALRHDPDSAATVAAADAPVVLMHMLGDDPRRMQDAPAYADVALDVARFLAARVAAAEAAGIPRERIALDSGIGFGKTLDHNLALLRRLPLLAGLGCPVLVGASRKTFIGRLSGVAEAGRRMPGSLAAALLAAARGAAILRVHDVAETVQALRVARAVAAA
jgi:dihydropteroate synthase